MVIESAKANAFDVTFVPVKIASSSIVQPPIAPESAVICPVTVRLVPSISRG